MADVIALWPDGAPGSETWSQQEKDHWFENPRRHRVTRNVVHPTLTVALPDPAIATGTGVIICPGGGHHFLAVDHEGHEVAQWLNERGIAGIMLKYRVLETPDDETEFVESMKRMRDPEYLPSRMGPHWPLALADGQQAVRLVREHAAEWGLRPDRIGIMGFSAGAHLTAGVTVANEATSRVDFSAPIYGGLFWQEVVAPADAPPLFTAFASDDPIGVGPGLALYNAWIAAGRRAEIHGYSRGGHGFGTFVQNLPTDGWLQRFVEWLAAEGLYEAPNR